MFSCYYLLYQALACDIRVAAENASIGLTFVKLGLHPGMGSTHFLPSITNHQIASKMLLTGNTISGLEAYKAGIVLETTHPSKVEDGEINSTVQRAIEIAEEISSAGPIAVRSCVRTLRLQQDDGLERALWREADAQATCYPSTDLGNGVQALKNRQSVEFSNREHYNEKS